MTDVLYKARLLRGDRDEDMDLAWNIHNVDYDSAQAMLIIYHKVGRVYHRLKEGDTIIMLQQVSDANKADNAS